MKKMTSFYPYQGMALMLAASLLSACAPNPSVLQDNVYGRYPQQPQPYPYARTPAAPVRPPLSTSSTHNIGTPYNRPMPRPPVVPPPQVDTTDAMSSDAAVVVPDAIGPETPQPARPPKKYDSSPAARALLKQANAEATDGKLADAAATIERALRIEPDNPDLWLKLSDLNKRQGNAQQAASMASKAQYYQELLN